MPERNKFIEDLRRSSMGDISVLREINEDFSRSAASITAFATPDTPVRLVPTPVDKFIEKMEKSAEAERLLVRGSLRPLWNALKKAAQYRITDESTATPDELMLEILNKPATTETIDALKNALARGANPNLEIKSAQSGDALCTRPLHLALRTAVPASGKQRNGLEYALVLLRHGADPNARNDYGQNALHLLTSDACALPWQDRLTLAKTMCAKGANPAACDHSGKSPYEGSTLQPAAQGEREWEVMFTPYTGTPMRRIIKTAILPPTLFAGYMLGLHRRWFENNAEKEAYQHSMRTIFDTQVYRTLGTRTGLSSESATRAEEQPDVTAGQTHTERLVQAEHNDGSSPSKGERGL